MKKKALFKPSTSEVPAIKAVRTYQPVQFEGSLRTFFAAPKERGRPMVDLELEIVFGNLVRIRSPKDDVMVPFTNVAFLALDSSEQTHDKPIALDHE